MSKSIIKDGKEYFYQKKLDIPNRDDFFVTTGEVEFGGGYQDTGYFNDGAFQRTQREHSENLSKKCEHRAGFYCKNKKCNYPACLK